ncbi:MAG TPA: amidohydrolase family protein, partial [Thermoanaerobaculia bacterium]|nr:amidohydrolase family protein [Thermoanaerobaculia bacterium]
APAAPPPPAASAPEAGLSFEEYQPRSTLVVPEHPVQRARYPFIDVHNHQPGTTLTAEQAAKLVAEMDKLNLAVMVNLSGGVGPDLAATVANMKGRYPSRFVVFANIDFKGIDDPDWGKRTAAQLEHDVKVGGAQGLKIFKNLGMFVRDASGKLVPADDARIDPVWEKCAELGIPVLIHTGEPSSFYQPWDRFNERWLELKEFPNRRRPPSEFGTWEETMAAQHRLFRKHPRTTFIDAHLGWLGNDLGALGKLFDELPNVMTEIGAVLAEIGRQPRNARAFFIRYQDRVMFGKDIWEPSEYYTYFRVLETDDEYFDYYRRRHAFWKIYGLDLPDDVLRKLYYKNALRVIPGIDASLFPKD